MPLVRFPLNDQSHSELSVCGLPEERSPVAHGSLCCRSSVVAVTPMIYPHRTLAGSPVPRRSPSPSLAVAGGCPAVSSARSHPTPNSSLTLHPQRCRRSARPPHLLSLSPDPHFCRRHLTLPCRRPVDAPVVVAHPCPLTCACSPRPPYLRSLEGPSRPLSHSPLFPPLTSFLGGAACGYDH